MEAGDACFGFIDVTHQTEICFRQWPRLSSRDGPVLVIPRLGIPKKSPIFSNVETHFPETPNEAITKAVVAQQSSLFRVDGAAK